MAIRPSALPNVTEVQSFQKLLLDTETGATNSIFVPDFFKTAPQATETDAGVMPPGLVAKINDLPDATTLDGALADKADVSTEIETLGLASGGGPLSALDPINVPKASQAEAEAGSIDTRAMTPVRTAQHVTKTPLKTDFPTLADLAAGSIPSVRTNLSLGGYFASGDGGGAQYKRISTPSPAKQWQKQAADGSWWELAEAVVDPRMFGCVGGSTSAAVATLPNDYTGLQALFDYVGLGVGKISAPNDRSYRTNTGLQLKVTRQLPAPPDPVTSEIFFQDNSRFVLDPLGGLTIRAGAAMTTLVEPIFNVDNGNIAPFMSQLSRLNLRGEGFAQYGIRSRFCSNIEISWCTMKGFTAACIDYEGYGGTYVHDCILGGGGTLIRMIDGGGDSRIEAIGFNPTDNGICIEFGVFGGNTTVQKNTFNGEGFANCTCVKILNTLTGGATGTQRHIRVLNNEFSGMTWGVDAYRVSGQRIYGLVIHGNHSTPSAGGTVHVGNIARLRGCDDCIVSGNIANARAQGKATGAAFLFYDCIGLQVTGNIIMQFGLQAFYLDVVKDSKFALNIIKDCGQDDSGGVVVDMWNGCIGNDFLHETIERNNASYSPYGYFERAGATGNYYDKVRISGTNPVGTPYILASGSTSTWVSR